MALLIGTEHLHVGIDWEVDGREGNVSKKTGRSSLEEIKKGEHYTTATCTCMMCMYMYMYMNEPQVPDDPPSLLH